jgi:hypothetical protein
MCKDLTEVSTRYFFLGSISLDRCTLFSMDRYRSRTEGQETRKRGKIGRKLEPGSKKQGQVKVGQMLFSLSMMKIFLFSSFTAGNLSLCLVPPNSTNSMPMFLLYKNIL